MGSIAMEEFDLMKDGKYRVYVNQVDKALKSFEYSSEWADLISALAKLNKVLQSNSKFAVIPRRIKISKRLAQCMHPALPFGVHLKALETYDIIFKAMGTNRLSHELFIYSAGLFPLFIHASMKVRPSLLDIYDNHFLSLGTKLMPALPGFLSGVLCGLEENSEFMARTNRMLEKVCELVGSRQFYGCLWDCLASNSAVRQPAVSFILVHFDRRQTTEDQPHIMGTNIETMVVGLIGCVEDQSVLVQRSSLDLLMVGFPMHNSHLTQEDMVRLVTASLSTVLRRDLSLTRRLYGWLLGLEVNMAVLAHHPLVVKAKVESRALTYFDVFSRSMLVEAINIILDNAIGQNPHDLSPYKLLRTLLDKQDFGTMIFEDIMFQVFRLFYLSYQQEPSHSSELVKALNVLLSALDPSFMWSYMARQISLAVKNPECVGFIDEENPVRRVSATLPSITEICAVSELLLDIVSVETFTDTPSTQLPELFLHIVKELANSVGALGARQISRALRFCSKLLSRFQPSVVAASRSSLPSPAQLLRDCLDKYERFYVKLVYHTRLVAGETGSVSDQLAKLALGSAPLARRELLGPAPEQLTLWVEPLQSASRLLVDLSTLQTFVSSSSVTADSLDTHVFGSAGDSNEVLPEWLRLLVVSSCYHQPSDPLRLVAISTLLRLVELCRTAETLYNSEILESGATPVLIIPLLTPLHINFLEKQTCVFQLICDWLWEKMESVEQLVESVELLHQVQSCLPEVANDAMDRYLSSASACGDAPPSLTFSFSKFTTLWHVGREIHAKLGNSLRLSDIFSRAMMRMLENMRSDSCALRTQAESWLEHCVMRGDLSRVVDPVLTLLLDSSTARLSVLHVRLQRDTDGRRGSGPSSHHHRKPRPRTIQAVTSLSPDLTTTLTTATSMPAEQISLYINPLSAASLNTDFDDFYDDTTLPADKSSRDQSSTASALRPKSDPKFLTRSWGNLEDEGRVSRLTGNLFTRISDGESEVCLGPADGWEMVRSWSYPGKALTSDLDESTPAEEYFSSGDSSSVVQELLNDIIDSVVILAGDFEEAKEVRKARQLQYQSTLTSGSLCVEHLHSHMLLYTEVYDGDTVLKTMRTLADILRTNPRLFLCAFTSTALVSRSSLLTLLSHHKKCLFGRGFGGEPASRSAMYVEVLVILCLYYLRSYYPPGLPKLTTHHILLNSQVQSTACELLCIVTNELVSLVRSSGAGLACYLGDLFSRLKVHKIALHCALTVLTHCSSRDSPSTDLTSTVLTHSDPPVARRHLDTLSDYSHGIQLHLSRLLASLIVLEFEVHSRSKEESIVTDKVIEGGELKYLNGKLIPHQPLFIAILHRSLGSQYESRGGQVYWTSLVTSTLHYLGSATTRVVTSLISQLCLNLETVSQCYGPQIPTQWFPVDYTVTQLEALTVLCHHCLLDTSMPFNQPPCPVPSSASALPSNHIFSNLTHLFSSSSFTSGIKLDSKESRDWQVSARKHVLGHLPRILSSVAILWQALVNRKDRESENSEVGSPRVVRQQILDLLSPIAKNHSTSFLAAMAIVWRERRLPATLQLSFQTNVMATEEQAVLVQLLVGIKALPMDTLVQTIHQVIKQPSTSEELGVEVSVLELFVQYTCQTGTSIADCWPKLCLLLRDGPSFCPPAQFLLVYLLSHFVHKCPQLSDKKDLKDLQDITSKLVECLVVVAGSCLEQTTWLRRNLAVREEDPPVVSPDKEDKVAGDTDGEPTEADPQLSTPEDPTIPESKKKLRKSKLKRVTKKFRQDALSDLHLWFIRVFVNEQPCDMEHKKSGGSMAGHSVSSLSVMAQLLAPLLDVVFGSNEKERVVTLVTNLMYNVTPYLKNHTVRNGNSFFASSQLVASLSGYQYTRKAWKKDAMELLLDPSFFQMESRSVPFWKTIVDNLVSQDAATFRELMGRISMAQGNGLSIFSSREQEYEQRAQLLKRLAFVILCSERDQFQKHMPEIQERLAEVVRLPHVVPGVLAQVMLCFRVLLLRMSHTHTIPLWPNIVSEMVQVLLNMELSLSTDSEEFSSQMGASLEWGLANGVGMGHPHWLQLQLATANLLFLCVQLPPDNLPQFQMYRWAFVGTESINKEQVSADFIPHVTRIASLMDAKFGCVEALPVPLLPHSIRSLQELHPFFTAMSSGRYTQLTLSQIEHNIELDFLDPLLPK